MTNYTKFIIRGSLFILFITALSALLGYSLRVILARNLEPIELGLFYAIFNFVMFFSLLRNFGLGAALIKYIPQYQVKNETHLISSSISSIFWLRILIAGLVSLILLSITTYLSEHYFKDPRATLIYFFIVLFFFFGIIVDNLRNLFEAFQKPFLFPLVDFSKNLVVLLLCIFLFYFSSLERVLIPGIAYFLSVVFLPFIFFPIFLYVFPLFKYSLRFNKTLAKEYLFFGLPFILISVSSIIISQVDTLILTYFRTLEEVGVYNIVLPTSLLLLYFSNALSSVLFPLCSQLMAKKDFNQLSTIIKVIQKYIFVVIVPIGFSLFVFARDFLGLLFGEEYTTGALALQILIPGVIFYVLSIVFQYILAGIGHPKKVAFIVGAAALTNLGLNLLLIPSFGINGAAITTSFSYILALGLTLYFLSKEITLSIPWKSWLFTFFAGFIFIITLDYLFSVLSFNYFVNLGISLIVSGLVYLALILLFKVVDLSEIALFLKKV